MSDNQFGGNIGNDKNSASGANAGGSTPTTNPSGTSGMSDSSSLTSSSFGTTEANETAAGGFSASVVNLLERFGVDESQLNSVRDTLKNVNLDQSLERAKETVTDSIGKAREYAKKNPAAVAAGLAVLVIGAGLIAAAATRKGHD